VKKAIAVILSVLFVFAVASLSLATEEKKAAPAPVEKKAAPAAEEKAAPAPAKVKMVKGEVIAVDAKAKSMTIKGKKGDVVIFADDKMMAEVKVGDKVEVKYTEVDGKNVAKSVKKEEAKAAETMEKKMEKKAEPAAKPAEKK